LVNFWNFKSSYEKITDFKNENNLQIKVIKNFDNQAITLKNILAKFVLIFVWFFIIYTLVSGKN
jgi:hypothetical protein